MKDSTIVTLSLIGSGALIVLALILRNKDKGTMLFRNERGEIEAILPLDSYFINQRTPPRESTTSSFLTTDFTENFQEVNK